MSQPILMDWASGTAQPVLVDDRPISTSARAGWALGTFLALDYAGLMVYSTCRLFQEAFLEGYSAANLAGFLVASAIFALQFGFAVFIAAVPFCGTARLSVRLEPAMGLILAKKTPVFAPARWIVTGIDVIKSVEAIREEDGEGVSEFIRIQTASGRTDLHLTHPDQTANIPAAARHLQTVLAESPFWPGEASLAGRP